MAKVLTTDSLIESIKRRALIPTNQSTFTTADFIDLLNEEIDTGLIPYLLRIHEEHLVTYHDEPLENDVRRYSIPYRSIGNKLRDASFIDLAGNVYELSRISLEQVSDFQGSYTTTRRNVFYIESDEIVLPNELVNNEGYLRMHYYLRPNTLVQEDEVGIISAINTTTGEITLSSIPTDFSSLPDMDFVCKRSPGKILSFDKTPVSVNSNTKVVTFATTDLPSGLVVGDYLCKAEETIIPQVPVELHPILAQRVAVQCLEALGDSEGLANARAKLERMEQNVLSSIDDRVDGAQQKILNRNGVLRDAVSRASSRRRKF